jgi:DNA-binding response OmpR family regulator
MTRILIIEDDAKYSKSLKVVLENKGYEIITALDGISGIKSALNHLPDLIILDFMLPNMDGVQTCRRLRSLTKTPIIILTARNDEASMVQGLDSGADDFLVKPSPHNILVAKIEAILRRSGNDNQLNAQYSDAYLTLELIKGKVSANGEDAKLTSTELRLLAYLFRNSDRVVPHEELIKEVWGEHSTTDKRSLKLYILYLRRKIEPNPDKPTYLKTAWGIGYRFQDPIKEKLQLSANGD